MAKFNEHTGALTFRPEPKPVPEKKKAKRKVAARWADCESCGISEKLSTKAGRFIDDHDQCGGCLDFFGSGLMSGCTNLDHISCKERLAELKEHKYGIILKSGSFADPHSGDSLGVELGDIFKVVRIGADKKPTGKMSWCMEAYTVDVMVNNRPLKLFLHEIASIPWVTIMLYRKEKAYIEAYLSDTDKEGYFAPTPETRAEIVNCFGDR